MQVASGTAVDVISECVSSSAASGFNLLSLIEEPGDYTQPKFTRSALLEQTDNLVGQFVANPDASKSNNYCNAAVCSAVYRFGLVGNVVGSISEVDQRRARLLHRWVTVSRRLNHQSKYVISHPGQLSLAIPPWVGAMSTGESWNAKQANR